MTSLRLSQHPMLRRRNNCRPLQIKISHAIIGCTSGALLLICFLLVSLLTARDIPDIAIDTNPARVAALKTFITKSPIFRDLHILINGSSRSATSIRFVLVDKDAPSNIVPQSFIKGFNSAYDQRYDAILISPSMARIFGGLDAGSWPADFITLLILHELGHRDAFITKKEILPTQKDEERADAYAIHSYISMSKVTPSELVEEVWNIAEGGILGIFTQSGSFNPLTNYTTHGSFFYRIAGFYKGLLSIPNMSADDLRFVKAMLKETEALQQHAKNFSVFSLASGHIATKAVDCVGAIKVITTNSVYAFSRKILLGASTETTYQPLMAVGPNNAPIIDIRKAICDQSGRLIIEIGEGSYFLENGIENNVIKFFPVDVNFVKKLNCRLCVIQLGIDIEVTNIMPRRTDDERLTLRGRGLSKHTLDIEPNVIFSASDDFESFAVAKPSGDKIDFTLFQYNGKKLFNTEFESIGLNAALGSFTKVSDIKHLKVSQSCVVVDLPGRFLALMDRHGKKILVDSYLSSTEFATFIDQTHVLVGLAFSRFLVVLTCR